MNKIISLFITVLCAISAQSQTLLKADIEPQIGENYLQHNCLSPEATDPGSEGKSQTWKLSNLRYNSNQDHELLVMHPDSTPYAIPGASFTIRKFLVADTYSVGYAYYKDTTTGYYLFRDLGSIIDTKYPVPEFIFKFPLAFGDSVTAAFQFSTSAFGTTYNYTETSKLKFDGTGTLVMPDSSLITGVYRLKYSSKTIRTTFNDTSYVTKYAWYKPGLHHPLAEYTEYTDANGLMYPSTKVYSTDNNAALDAIEQYNSIHIFPNPAANLVNITSSEIMDGITLTNLSGKVVLAQNQLHQTNFLLNTKDLSNGIYLLQIHKNQQVFTHKIIVEH